MLTTSPVAAGVVVTADGAGTSTTSTGRSSAVAPAVAAASDAPQAKSPAGPDSDNTQTTTNSNYDDSNNSSNNNNSNNNNSYTGDSNNRASASALDEVLRCFICFDPVRDASMCPKCGKLACAECIHTWIKDHNHSQCPHCRTELKAEQLVTCRFVDELQAQLKELRMRSDAAHGKASISTATSTPTPTPQDAVRAAYADPSALPPPLPAAAAQANSKQGNVASGGGKRKSSTMTSGETCVLHKTRELIYYCQTCSEPICADCALFSKTHKTHDFQRLELVYQSSISDIEHSLRLLSDAEHNTDEQIAGIDSLIANTEQSRLEALEALDRLVGYYREALSGKAQKRLDELGRVRSLYEGVLNDRRVAHNTTATLVERYSKAQLVLCKDVMVERIESAAKATAASTALATGLHESITAVPVTSSSGFTEEFMPEYEFETVRIPGVRAFIDQCKALPAPSADGENTARCTFVSEPFLASGTVWILEVSGDYEGTLSVYLTLAVGSQSTSTFFFNVNIVHPVQAGRTFSRDFWDEFRAGTTRGLRSIISFDDLVEQGFLHPRQSQSSPSSSPSTADKTEVDAGESDVLVIRYGVAPELYKQKCDNQQQYIGELESTVRKLQLEMDSMTSAEPQQPQSPEDDPYLTPQHRLASTLNQSNQNGSAAEIIAMLSPTFSAATLPARSARSNGNNGFTIATSSNEALVGAQYGDGLTSPLEMTAFDSAVPPAVPQSNIVDFGPASVPPPDPAKSKDAINNDHDDWDFLSSSQRVDFPQSSPSLSSSSFTASSSAEIEAYLDKDRASERHQQQQHHSHQQHQQQQQQQQQQHQFRRPAGRSLSDGSQLRRYMEDNEESFDGDGDISSGLSGSFASSSLSASFTALPDAAKQYNNDTAVSLSSSQRARRSSYDSPGNDIMGPMSGQGLGNARLRSVQNRGSNVGVAEESRAPQTMDSSLRAAVIRNVNHILARRQSGLLDRSHNRSNAGSASSGQSALTRPAAAMPVQSTTGVDQPRTPVASENTFIPTNMIPSINQTTSAPSAQHQPAISNAQQPQTQQHQQQQHQQQQQQTKPRSSLRDRRISTLHKQVTFRSTPLVFPGTPRQWGNTSTSSTASSPGSGSSGSGNHRIKSALRNSPRRSGPTSVRHKIAARGKGHVRLGSKTGSGTSKHGSSKDTGLTLGDELNSNDDDDDDDDDLMLHSSEISEIATMQVGNMAASVDSETDGSVGNLGHSFDESRIRQLDQSVTLLLQRAQNDIATVQKTPAASSQYSYPQRSEGGISSPPPIAPSRNHRLRSDSYDSGELQAAAATSSAHSPPVPAEPPMSAIIAPVDVHSSRVKYADHQAPQIDEADPSVPVLLHHLQSASGIEALLRRRRTDPQFAARIKEEYSEYQRSRVRRPLESDPVDIDASAMIMVNGEVGIRVEALRKAERERRRQTFDPSELSFAANAPQAGNAAARQTTGDAGVLAGTRHSNPTTTTATTAATAVSIHRDERGGGGRLTSDFARRRRTFAPMSSGEAPAAGSTAAFPTLANNSPPQYTQLHRRSWIASRSPDSIAATMALGANPGQSRYQHGYYGHSGGGNGEGGGSGEHAADSLSSSTEQSASGSQHVDLVGSVMIPVMDSTAVAALRNLSNDGYYQQSHHRTSSAAPSTSSSNHPSASTSKPTSPLESAYRLDPLPQSRTRASTAITDANQPMQDANQHQSQLQEPRSESISRVSRLHRSPPVIGSHLSSRPIHSSGSGNGGGGGGGGGGSGLVSRSRLNFGYSGPGTAMGSMSGGDNSSNEDLARSVAISVSQIAQPRLSSAASAASASSSSSSSNPTVSAAAGIQLNKRTSFVGNLNGRGGQQMSAGSSSSSTSYRNLSPTKSVSRERPSNTSGNSSGSGGAGGGIGDGSTSSSLQRLSASRTSSTATVSSVNSSLRQQPQPQRGSIQSMARHQQQQLQQQQPSSIRSNADSARLLRSKRLGQTTASATLSNPDYGDVSPSNNDASRCLTSIFNQPAPHQS